MKKAAVALLLAVGMLLACAAGLAESWICDNCQAENTGNFCGNCGAAKPTPEPLPEPESAEWTCPDCLSLNTTNFCSNCGRKKPDVSSARTLIVEEPVYGAMDVPGIFVGETIVIPEEPAVVFSGSLSGQHEEDSYSFTAPRNGRYRFDLEDVMSDARIHLTVTDSKNKIIIDTFSRGISGSLTSGETYRVRLKREKGTTDYTLKIGVQKPATDISNATTVYDQVAFEDQRNVYHFTAPIAGRYRFDLTETSDNTGFNILVWDRLDKNILDTYSKGAYISMAAGETYHLQVRHRKNLGSYIMRVYFQKNTVDVTGYGIVNDSIEYEDQKNVYMFTAPVSGRYRFDLAETNANTGFRMMMWDRLDKNFLDTYSKGAYVILDAGETYQLQVRQNKGAGTYRLLIGYQKETVDITGMDAVYDRITWDDQKNVYLVTPSRSGEYAISLSEYDSTSGFRLMAWDKYDKNILDTYSGSGKLTLEANETYQIQVRQNKGHGSYCLNVRMK